MDIEKLTKSQIVLLTLLISFVTSIATGIVTVSLMQQAPPTVAETVNRIIEHTIEAATSTPKSQTATVVQQKTVVVNESDLVVQAVKAIGPSIVKLYSSADTSQFLGLGVVVDASGTVAADIGALGDRPEATLEMSDGSTVRSLVTSRDTSSGFLYLTPDASSSPALTWTPAPLAQTAPQLGELVVAIEGETNVQISQGLLTSITPADQTTGTPDILGTSIDASSVLPGSLIIDTDGNVVGVSTGISRASSPSGFIPSSALNETNSEN